MYMNLNLSTIIFINKAFILQYETNNILKDCESDISEHSFIGNIVMVTMMSLLSILDKLAHKTTFNL